MIIEYYRPKNILEAAALLEQFPDSGFLVGGGSHISTHQPENGIAIDLQAVTELKEITRTRDNIHIGTLVTLQQMLESEWFNQQLRNAIKYENGQNIRQTATIGGLLVTTDGRSPLAACLLALNLKIILHSRETMVDMEKWFEIRANIKPKVIITGVVLDYRPILKFEYSARTPKDRPLVFAATALWPNGRIRITLAGFGDAPVLVYDGLDASGAANAASNAYSSARDFRASANYRSDVAGKLTERLLKF